MIINFLSIPEPETWGCELRGIQNGACEFRLGSRRKSMRLVFEGLVYYEGNTSWDGARFDLMTREELPEGPPECLTSDQRRKLLEHCTQDVRIFLVLRSNSVQPFCETVFVARNGVVAPRPFWDEIGKDDL